MMAGYMYASSAFSIRGIWSLSSFSMVMWLPRTLFSVHRKFSCLSVPSTSSHAVRHRGKAQVILSVCPQGFTSSIFKGNLHWKLKGMSSYDTVTVTPSQNLTIHFLLCGDPTMVYDHVPCRTQRKDSFCKTPWEILVNTVSLNLWRYFSKSLSTS